MKLVCLGASNPETIRIIHKIQAMDKKFKFLGFLDNDETKWGKEFHSFPILGGMSEIPELNKKGAVFCNLITRDCTTRYETTMELIKKGARLANLIHPIVNLEMVTIGVGNYIQECVILQAGVSIGNNSSIHIGSLIGHETKIGNSVFVAHGCNVSGLITIEDGVFCGTGVTILPRLKIGRWSIIGAGTVVIDDVPPYSVVVGNPGRIIKQIEKRYETGEVLNE